MSESPVGDAAEASASEEIPDLVDEPDNDPADSAEYVVGETQDREGTERPAVDKHPED